MIARADALRALASERFEVVVVGGGITGAGVALDAASRGYSVALIEAADYASGTSSRSSKLVHGGLRYLQNFDLGLVREALLERQLMVRLAPHLVRPLPFVVPAFGGAKPDRKIGVGLNLYDAMAVDGRRADDVWSPERHRVISAERGRRAAARPWPPREPTSGYLFYDCQTDDSRLVLTVLGEAERYGAVLANRVRATDVLDGRVAARDELTRRLLRAAGRQRDQRHRGVGRPPASRGAARRGRAAVDPAEPRRARRAEPRRPAGPRRGDRPGGGGALDLRAAVAGRDPVGTTDTDHDETDLDHVRPEAADVAYLLDSVNAFFGTALRTGDVAGAYAGVRPLIATADPRKSVDISRRAELFETSSGMITITGGKLTTWRRMARMAVDRLVERDARDAPCRTHEIPLGQAVDAAALPRVAGVPEDAYERLAGRYGHAAHEVLRIAAGDPALAAPIAADAPPDLLAEAVVAARLEQATTVGDVLLRRTRTALLAARAVTEPAVARRVAVAMAPELGWDAAAIDAAAAAFLDEAAAEGIVLGPDAVGATA